MTLSAAEETAIRQLLGRMATDKFSGTPLRGGIPQLVQRTALPTAAKELNGQVIWIPGVAGVADGAWICLKNAADAYAWHEIDDLATQAMINATALGGELGGTVSNGTVNASHSGSTHAAGIATSEAYSNAADAVHVAAADPHLVYVLEASTPGGELGGTYDVPTVNATHSGSAHVAILRYYTGSEATTTGTSAADLLDISALNIPVTSTVIVTGVARKTAGAAALAALGLKINSTITCEAAGGTNRVWVASATNQAEDGVFCITIFPRSANYLNSAVSSWTNAVSGVIGASVPVTQTAACPNAAITHIVLRGIVGSASITLGIQNISVIEIVNI